VDVQQEKHGDIISSPLQTEPSDNYCLYFSGILDIPELHKQIWLVKAGGKYDAMVGSMFVQLQTFRYFYVLFSEHLQLPFIC